MAISVFDLFKIGIGPSSSHTVGPMRAARSSRAAARTTALLDAGRARAASSCTARSAPPARATAATRPSCWGCAGDEPDSVDVDAIRELVQRDPRASTQLRCSAQAPTIAFDERDDLMFIARETLPLHSNGMRFTAFDAAGAMLRRAHLLLGGRRLRGQRRGGRRRHEPRSCRDRHPGCRYPFHTGDELLARMRANGTADRRRDAAQRAPLAHRRRDRRGPARIWARHAGLRRSAAAATKACCRAASRCSAARRELLPAAARQSRRRRRPADRAWTGSTCTRWR